MFDLRPCPTAGRCLINPSLDKIKAYASSRAECTVDAEAQFTRIKPPDDGEFNWEIVGLHSGVFSSGKTMRMIKNVKITGSNDPLYVLHGTQVYGHIEQGGTTVRCTSALEPGSAACVLSSGKMCWRRLAKRPRLNMPFFVFHSDANIVVDDDCIFSSGVVMRTYVHN